MAVAQQQQILQEDPGKEVDFAMQEQECSNWCWAAVASSIDVCYADGGPSLSQCQLASKVLANQGDCCNHPIPVPLDFHGNLTAHTADALKVIQRLRGEAETLDFSEVKAEIGNGNVIGCAVGDGGTHAVAIVGWNVHLGKEHVLVKDPFGDSSRTLEYGSFKDDNTTNFEWQRTYLTTRVSPAAELQGKQFLRRDAVVPVDSRILALSEQASLLSAHTLFANAAMASPPLAEHHKMFIATVEQARDGSVLAERPLACWRNILFEGEPRIPEGASEVTENGRILSVSRGPSALASFTKIQDIAGRPDVQNLRAEPRYLKVIGLSLVAIWLHNMDDGTKDEIFPLAPTKWLSTERSYMAEEFLAACKAAASQRGTVQP